MSFAFLDDMLEGGLELRAGLSKVATFNSQCRTRVRANRLPLTLQPPGCPFMVLLELL